MSCDDCHANYLTARARAAAQPRGVPYDQLLALHAARMPGTDGYVRIYNRDGSEAGACGNGMRCLAELLFTEIGKDAGGIDILVNDVWGGDRYVEFGVPFWECSLDKGRLLIEQALWSHLVTSRHAVPWMLERPSGLIVDRYCVFSFRYATYSLATSLVPSKSATAGTSGIGTPMRIAPGANTIAKIFASDSPSKAVHPHDVASRCPPAPRR